MEQPHLDRVGGGGRKGLFENVTSKRSELARIKWPRDEASLNKYRPSVLTKQNRPWEISRNRCWLGRQRQGLKGHTEAFGVYPQTKGKVLKDSEQGQVGRSRSVPKQS